jgi:arylsulfatase A-like enzyme
VARPSVLLAVLDTVRVDAVSAYGQIDGTTPTLDRLAADGLRYTQAFSHANWTVPSHAALFTGLLPSATGMGYVGAPLPPQFPTLAETLGGAGYETAGFCENPWLNGMGLARGFERFVELNLAHANDMPDAVARWAQQRDPSRPFFLFLNIMDAHEPYPVRADNPWLPPWIPLAEANHAADHVAELRCATDGRQSELDLLRRLYWQGVQQADAKLGRVLAALTAAGLRDGLRIIVLADHGEHFGERRRVLHDIGVGNALIHVPLVVNGLPGIAPAVIATPVGLADIYPTVLGWADLPMPPQLVGRPLPVTPDDSRPPRRIVSQYREELPGVGFLRPFETLRPGAIAIDSIMMQLRAFCTPDDRADGDQTAVIEWPKKLIWYQNYPPELFDLEQDPGETVDLSSQQPAVVDSLLATARAADSGQLQDLEAVPVGIEHMRAERLRALGYLIR